MKKSRRYMKGAEFQARQGWLPFVDAVGIVLEVLEPVKAAAWAWFRKWKKAFRSPRVETVTAVQLWLFGDTAAHLVNDSDTKRGKT